MSAQADYETREPGKFGEVMTLPGAGWAAKIAAAQARLAAGIDRAPTAEELAEETRREQLAVKRAAQWALYQRDRDQAGTEFAEAAYDRLEPGQDPKRRISGWWRSGAKNLLVAGQPGRGKTHAAFAILNEVAADSRDGRTDIVAVRAVHVGELRNVLTHVMAAHETRDTVASEARAKRAIDVREADLLLIDDLTAANITDAFRQQFHALIDYRINHGGKRTIITMNADAKEDVVKTLDERVGAAILSRIRMDCLAAWVEGDDRRQWTRKEAVFDW